jgi:hypothetical protein
VKAGSYARAVHPHGDGNERYAGEEEPVASATDVLPGDEDGPWDDAGLSDASGLYQGFLLTREGGSWDNLAADQACVVAT